jgi:hypothetical protein
MKRVFVLAFVFALFCLNVSAQTQQTGKSAATAGDAAKNDNTSVDLAASAVNAHGGDKFKNMKTLIVRGSVDITTSAIAQAIPATFSTVFSGEKYRIEINNPFTPFQQVFDGQITSSTLRGGFTLPPLNRLGLPLLSKIGEKGFIVSVLPGEKKKKKGFRITSPEGFYTDFYLDDKTNQIKGYDSSYEINGRSITTSVEIDKYKNVEGVVVPEKYAQRFDMGQMTAYANFKAKEILVNSKVEDNVFVLGK